MDRSVKFKRCAVSSASFLKTSFLIASLLNTQAHP
ncbi:MAG: hypothetical protein ACI8Z1_003979, partial [Candidatus Azotimanducaceae bacterium]